jgi:hypothetical protein
MNSGRDDPPDRPYRRNPLAGMEVLWIDHLCFCVHPRCVVAGRNPLAGIEVL